MAKAPVLNNIIKKPLDNGSEFFLPSSVQIPTVDVNNLASNVIPETAKATINIRFNNLHTIESLKKWLKEKIDETFKNLDNASCEFSTFETGNFFLTKPGFLSKLVSDSISEITGKNSNPEMATDGGTSDARFIKDYCEVIELGITNKTLHQVNEHVNINDIKNLHDIYLKILEKYFKKN